MTNQLKIKLLLFWLISSISFSYLFLPESSGIGITIFYVVHFACLWFVCPNRKRLFIYIPVFVFALNSFFSANTIWRIPNLFVSVLLFSGMWTDFSIKEDNLRFIPQTLLRLADSIEHFSIPFKWILELNSGKTSVIKKVAVAVLFAIPCAFILIVVLSNADMVFSLKTVNLIDSVISFFSISTVFRIILGVVFGLFLFSILFNAHARTEMKTKTINSKKGDLIIINILLSTALLIYTVFVIIQFKYLFAGASLPAGLNYTQYARKGFFELLSLTGVNVLAILLVIRLTKTYDKKRVNLTKILCYYLLIVTVVLLVSSFYRMTLYTGDDGLTRLRFFVLGFLIFELVGLILTFIYIAKPNFNIVLCYFIIAFAYYLVLNLVPTDKIVAKNQLEKYLNGSRRDAEYVFELSCDAVDEIKYLIENCDDDAIKHMGKQFIAKNIPYDTFDSWQSFNLSTYRAKKSLK